jgi:hypothetical protein
MDSETKRMRALGMQGALSSLETTRDQLNDLRELVSILIEKKTPIYQRRLAAIIAGDVKTCDDCNAQLMAITQEIREINEAAHELAQDDARKVCSAQEVPK